MCLTEKHFENIQFKINDVKNKHNSTMSSISSISSRESFNPNQPFKSNWFKKYREISDRFVV